MMLVRCLLPDLCILLMTAQAMRAEAAKAIEAARVDAERAKAAAKQARAAAHAVEQAMHDRTETMFAKKSGEHASLYACPPDWAILILILVLS